MNFLLPIYIWPISRLLNQTFEDTRKMGKAGWYKISVVLVLGVLWLWVLHCATTGGFNKYASAVATPRLSGGGR